MLRIVSIVQALGIVKKRKELDHLRLRPSQNGQAQPSLTHPGPVRSTVNPSPLQRELAPKDLHECLVYDFFGEAGALPCTPGTCVECQDPLA